MALGVFVSHSDVNGQEVNGCVGGAGEGRGSEAEAACFARDCMWRMGEACEWGKSVADCVDGVSCCH
jgi:hypothetical protein